MSSAVQLVTADELLRMPDDGFRYELVKGELIKWLRQVMNMELSL